jgi:hypothetical protein
VHRSAGEGGCEVPAPERPERFVHRSPGEGKSPGQIVSGAKGLTIIINLASIFHAGILVKGMYNTFVTQYNGKYINYV